MTRRQKRPKRGYDQWRYRCEFVSPLKKCAGIILKVFYQSFLPSWLVGRHLSFVREFVAHPIPVNLNHSQHVACAELQADRGVCICKAQVFLDRAGGILVANRGRHDCWRHRFHSTLRCDYRWKEWLLHRLRCVQ